MTSDPNHPHDHLAQPDHPLRDPVPQAAEAAFEAAPEFAATRSDPPNEARSKWSRHEQEDGAVGTSHYNQKAKQSLKLMLGRQVFIQAFTFTGGIILARTLTPEIFGIFGISIFLVNALALLGDFGLAPSLVQRKDEFSEQDLQVAFTLQQALLTTVATAIWIAAPQFLRIYPDLGGTEMVWLIRVMAFLLFLQSWRSMSVLQMERHLDFKKVAGIEIVEALSYQGLAVVLALLGFGVWSLVWATLTRGLLGTALAFAASPWRVRFAWETTTAKQLLRFGMPFQAGQILNAMGNWVTPLAVGTLVGPAGVGLLTWAGSNARKPLLFLHNLVRVSFPHFARLQDEPQGLLRIYERYLFPPLLFGGFWLALIIVVADELVPVIYTAKWAPAIPALYLYGALLALHTVDQVTGTLLRSTGKVNSSTAITGVTTALQIALAVPLIPWLGFLAVPVGMLAAFAFKSLALLAIAPSGTHRVAMICVARVIVPTTSATLAGLLASSWFDSLLGRILVSLSTVVSMYAIASYGILPDWLQSRIHGTMERIWDLRTFRLPRPSEVET